LRGVQNDMAALVEACRRGSPGPPTREDPTPAADHYRKVATKWADKYSLDTSKGRGRRGWHRLFPKQMRGNVKRPMKPETTYTDNFDRADQILGNTEPWSQVNLTDEYNVHNNEVALPRIDLGKSALARYEKDLSGDDHETKLRFVDANFANLWFGPAARFDGAAETCYMGMARENDYRAIRKTESGSKTVLWSDSVGVIPPYDQTLTVDGSTITYSIDGSDVKSLSDTSITGTLRGGVNSYASYSGDGTNEMWADNFEAADLSAAAAVVPRQLFTGAMP